MRIFIGFDHRGEKLAYKLMEELLEKGYEVNQPVDSEEADDYPDISSVVCASVKKNKGSKGILICGTGVGMCMAANKELAMRAVLAHNVADAYFARIHEDANILVLAAGYKDEKNEVKTPSKPLEIVEAFLNTEFEGGRHERRVKKLNKIGKE